MDLNYADPGGTCVADAEWTSRPEGYREFERSMLIGRGEEDWDELSAAVMRWEVKTRSGFKVKAVRRFSGPARLDENYTAVTTLGPFTIREPVRVIAVVDEERRRGFAYGTQNGHPLAGEEAFVVHRDDEDAVWLTLRSLTRPAGGSWKLAYPGVLLAQRVYRKRYLRAFAPA